MSSKEPDFTAEKSQSGELAPLSRDQIAKIIRESVHQAGIEAFAVRDVVRFQREINQKLPEDERNDIYERGKAAQAGKGMAVAIVLPGTKPSAVKRGGAERFTKSAIMNTAEKVMRTESAECQSFAQLLCALIERELPDCRVQIVASRQGLQSHNYVLINYEGDGLKFGDLGKQRSNVLIGDLWLLALGHNKVEEVNKYGETTGLVETDGIYTFDQYPKKAYLKSLTETYDSKAPFKGLEMDIDDLSEGSESSRSPSPVSDM